MKIARVKKSKEFLDTLAKGREYRGKLLFLYSKKESSREIPSIGVIITKSRAPKATQRNYIKRIIYSFFDTRSKAIKAGTVNVVKLAKDVRTTKGKPLSQAIRTELEELTAKAGVL